MTAGTKKKTRFRRRDWLATAMDVLSREGGAYINIDYLCRELGVTKGSFYAHFKGRSDFVAQLIDYWRESLTQGIIDEMEDSGSLPPEDRLLALMRLLSDTGAARYDTAVRAWAARDAVVAEGVRAADRDRFQYVRGIFEAMGFRGAVLDLRTRVFVVYHSSELGMRLADPALDSESELMLRQEFFTCGKN